MCCQSNTCRIGSFDAKVGSCPLGLDLIDWQGHTNSYNRCSLCILHGIALRLVLMPKKDLHMYMVHLMQHKPTAVHQAMLLVAVDLFTA